MPKGTIVKITGGNFYVKNNNQRIVCHASGKLRDYNMIPFVGDEVTYEELDGNKGYIKSIGTRSNSLVRPPVSNIDQALIVVSLKEPDFSSLLLEKMILQVLDNDITPVIYFSKKDKVKNMDKFKPYFEYYESIGIKCYVGNSLNLENKSILEEIFKDKRTILTGQSGAGKSTLLNAINPNLNLKTGDFSHSLGRGRHTTREVEFLEIANGLVADTPGFSSLSLNIDPDRLACIYPGFEKFNECKYRGCKHDKEISCKIKEEVNEGKILKESYNNYLKILYDIRKGGRK